MQGSVGDVDVRRAVDSSLRITGGLGWICTHSRCAGGVLCAPRATAVRLGRDRRPSELRQPIHTAIPYELSRFDGRWVRFSAKTLPQACRSDPEREGRWSLVIAGAVLLGPSTWFRMGARHASSTRCVLLRTERRHAYLSLPWRRAASWRCRRSRRLPTAPHRHERNRSWRRSGPGPRTPCALVVTTSRPLRHRGSDDCARPSRFRCPTRQETGGLQCARGNDHLTSTNLHLTNGSRCIDLESSDPGGTPSAVHMHRHHLRRHEQRAVSSCESA